MNYRHAFHAGNAGDCLKHALLVQLQAALQRKPTQLFVLDTHAGAYDLAGEAATCTDEWRPGIGRLLDAPPAPLRDYVAMVSRLGLYPGSSVLLREMPRPGDRLACCELHPEDYASLHRHFATDRRTGVHHRDAWDALGALLLPAERCGLTLMDSPDEETDEFARLVEGLRRGYTRLPTGVFAAWYPIKHCAQLRDGFAAIYASGSRDAIAAELFWRAPVDASRFNGCDLLVVNALYRFEEQAETVLAALLDRLGDRDPGEGIALMRLVDE